MTIPPASSSQEPAPPARARSARPGRRRLPAWAKVILWAGGTAAGLTLMVVLWLAAMFSGGLDDLLDRPGPFAEDARVVAAHDEAAATNSESVAAAVEVVSGAVDPGTGLASATTSSCTQGQHNWKTDDGYDLACTLSGAALLQAGTSESFRDDMLALDGRLLDAGWTAQDAQGMTALLDEYWADRAGILDANRDVTYPAHMPGPGYVRGGEWLAVSWAQPGAGGLGGYEYAGETRWTAADGRVLDGDATPDLLAPGTYGVVLVVGREYFRE